MILKGSSVDPEVGHEVNHVVNQTEVHVVNHVVSQTEVHVPVMVSAPMGPFAFVFFVWAPGQRPVDSLQVEAMACDWA